MAKGTVFHALSDEIDRLKAENERLRALYLAFDAYRGGLGHSWRCEVRKGGETIFDCVCGLNALEAAYETVAREDRSAVEGRDDG